MQLSGRLQLTTLGDLLGTLLREQLSGTLELTEEKGPASGRTHRLHLTLGHVVQVDTQETVQRLGAMLSASGWFDECELSTFVTEAAREGVPLGRWLVVHGHVPSDAMVEAVVQQIRLRLEALFRVQDARVAFRLVQSRRRELDAPRILEPREYLAGRPRARDRAANRANAASGSSVSTERRRDLLLLGLGQNADEAAVRAAFRRQARSLHPDAHPGASEGERTALQRRFVEVSGAYHRLLAATKIAV